MSKHLSVKLIWKHAGKLEQIMHETNVLFRQRSGYFGPPADSDHFLLDSDHFLPKSDFDRKWSEFAGVLKWSEFAVICLHATVLESCRVPTSSSATSNVPPPRSATNTVASCRRSRPYASAAATGSLRVLTLAVLCVCTGCA